MPLPPALTPSGLAARLRSLWVGLRHGDTLDAPDMIVSVTGPLDAVYEGDWYLILAVSLGAGLLVGVLLALAASGIYAIMSFAVVERTPEIGLRAALGAGRRNLMVSVARRAVAQIAIGVLIGIPFAGLFLVNNASSPYLGAGRTLVVGIVVMAVVGLAACTGPTVRALRIPPIQALKGGG